MVFWVGVLFFIDTYLLLIDTSAIIALFNNSCSVPHTLLRSPEFELVDSV